MCQACHTPPNKLWVFLVAVCSLVMGQSQEKITFLQQLLHLARLLVLAPTTAAASWSNGPSYFPGFRSCLMCLDSCVLLLMKVSLFSSCHATFFSFYLFYTRCFSPGDVTTPPPPHNYYSCSSTEIFFWQQHTRWRLRCTSSDTRESTREGSFVFRNSFLISTTICFCWCVVIALLQASFYHQCPKNKL